MGSTFSHIPENSIEGLASLAFPLGRFGLFGPGSERRRARNRLQQEWRIRPGRTTGGGRLGGNLGQYVHALDLGRDPEILAWALLHA